MTVQNSVAVKNARLNADETTIGTAPILFLKTGAQSASCAQSTSDGHAANGTKVASITLPSDWLADASAGSKAKTGSAWTDSSADAAGIIAHYELWDSTLTTCHEQGSVSEAGGGGDIILDNTDVNAGQSITISSWSKTA